jgi:hypothetical protein
VCGGPGNDDEHEPRFKRGAPAQPTRPVWRDALLLAARQWRRGRV